MERGTAFAPLRERNFRWYFLSLSVNTAGSTMAPVALAFAVLEVSDSASALGLVLAANSVPMVLLVLFGGVVADRLPRVLVMRFGNLVLAASQAATGVLVITGTAELWQMVALQVVNGSTLALSYPALAGLTPQLVPRALLQQANVLQSMVRGGLRVLGPTVGALLVVTVGPGVALVVDGVAWVLAALLLAPIRIPPRQPGAPTSTWHELREGWALFAGTTWLWVVVLAFGFINAVMAGAWNTLGPALAKDTIGEAGWGLVLSAESLGLLAITVVMLRRRLERPLLSGMLGISLMGVPLLCFGAGVELVPLMAVAFLAGVGIELFGIGWALAMQENIEERMLSRAYSYDMLGSFVAIPIGQLVAGPLGAAYGYRPVLVVGGIACVVIALLTLTSRSVRDLRRTPVDA